MHFGDGYIYRKEDEKEMNSYSLSPEKNESIKLKHTL